MWYIGIDQHKRYLTICVRDEQGDVVQRRQVKTAWVEVQRFLERLAAQAVEHGGYVAVMEVCGFNGWLIRQLNRRGCVRVIVVAAPDRVRQKTDRRDAARLSELLWMNRDRITNGARLLNLKEVYQPTEQEQQDRQITMLRHRLGRRLTRVKNLIQAILRRHNLEQTCPTKGKFTRAARKWQEGLARAEGEKAVLPEIDRVELWMALEQHDLLVVHRAEAEALIRTRAKARPAIRIVRTLPTAGAYTGLALLAYIGPIARFPRARSLPNFFGLTPGCRNSGGPERPGHITKAGHPFVRFLLGQMVLHALRKDPGMRAWYQKIKHRRGAKIARVAVMRRLCEALWHMLTQQEAYRPMGQAGASAPSVGG